jgi:hypothetical protein
MKIVDKWTSSQKTFKIGDHVLVGGILAQEKYSLVVSENVELC